MNRRIVSGLLVFLLLTSVAVPAASAEPGPFGVVGVAVAAPESAELVIGGITAIVSGVVVIEIGKQLGKTWDGVAETWARFVKDVSTGVDNLLHAKRWIKVTSQEGEAVMAAVYECFNARGSSGGKKDDKWYLEARRSNHQIEINPELMTREEAVKKMGEGKDIMTLNDKLTKKLLERAYGNKNIGKLENHGVGKDGKVREGYFWHRHPENQNSRNHVWMWKIE